MKKMVGSLGRWKEFKKGIPKKLFEYRDKKFRKISRNYGQFRTAPQLTGKHIDKKRSRTLCGRNSLNPTPSPSVMPSTNLMFSETWEKYLCEFKKIVSTYCNFAALKQLYILKNHKVPSLVSYRIKLTIDMLCGNGEVHKKLTINDAILGMAGLTSSASTAPARGAER